jgi:hypothetical protein
MIRFEPRARTPRALRLGTHFVVAVAAALRFAVTALGLMTTNSLEAA